MRVLIFVGLVTTILAAPQGTAEELALLKSKLLLFQNVTGASDAEVDRLWNQGQQTGELSEFSSLKKRIRFLSQNKPSSSFSVRKLIGI